MLKFAIGGAVAYPALRLLDNRTELPADFIRPPGVVEAAADADAAEQRFTELCIKCGQCLKVCLTNGLQPALTEAGLGALWTPRLVARMGECEFNCNLCGQACPTEAIPRLSLEDKQQVKMGLAYFDSDRCIPWHVGVNCTVCEEHCPTSDKAIKLEEEQAIDSAGNGYTLLRPYVQPELCTGCGICERVCPVVGAAAVRVLRRTPGAAYSGEPAGSAAGYGDYSTGGGDYGGDYGSADEYGDYPE
jgi:MauM/NapG family ferredoxin protein